MPIRPLRPTDPRHASGDRARHASGDRARRAPVERAPGFTVVELMVTLTVLAVILAIGMPSFGRLVAANRMATRTNDFVTMLNLARAEAVRRGQPVAAGATDGADFARGWSIFTDANADGAMASPATAGDGTVIRTESAASGRTTVKRVTRAGTAPDFTYADATSSVADRGYIVFNPRGGNAADTALFFRVCDPQDVAASGRIVQVTTVGRVSLDSTTASCS